MTKEDFDKALELQKRIKESDEKAAKILTAIREMLYATAYDDDKLLLEISNGTGIGVSFYVSRSIVIGALNAEKAGYEHLRNEAQREFDEL